MGSKISPSAIQQINKRILAHYENNGYPFAAVFYSNLKIEGDKVSGILQVEKGPLITMDTVSISGDCKLSKRYLQSYLSISPGDPYDERIVRRVPDRIKELPMVTEIRPFSVGFSNDKSVAFLYLKDKKASQADGVIGVQPPAKTDADAKTRVTADLRIRLLSAFGRGELLDFNWRQPSPLTQDLKARFSYPFLFDSPFGVDAGIAIYKKDTTYLDVELDGGLQFLLDGGNFLKVFFKNKKSSLISTARYKNTTVLPPFADISKSLYGVGLRKFSLDYRLNPRKGYSVELSASAGNRKIEINTDLPKALYDSLDLQSLQFSSELNGNIYLPIASRLVAAVGCRSGWIFGGDLFENELTRLGGMATLRGFDEESIKASSFVIGRFEMRYILERNSNFYLFLDQGWLERGSGQSYFRDTPYGFGAGISFDSKMGIFSINYGLGSEQDNPIVFRSAKVHFGVVNFF
jgi:outer membrane protein assembly factor BamA